MHPAGKARSNEKIEVLVCIVANDALLCFSITPYMALRWEAVLVMETVPVIVNNYGTCSAASLAIDM